MIKNKQTFFLGIFILLVWTFFGIPTSWKIFLTILSALYLIVLSVKILLPRRGSVRVQARRKEKITPVWSESSPVQRDIGTKSQMDALNAKATSGAGHPVPTLPSIEVFADIAASSDISGTPDIQI
jgi:hypothetical protein